MVLVFEKGFPVNQPLLPFQPICVLLRKVPNLRSFWKDVLEGFPGGDVLEGVHKGGLNMENISTDISI